MTMFDDFFEPHILEESRFSVEIQDVDWTVNQRTY